MVEKENSGKRLKGVLHRTQRYSAPKRGNHRDTADLFPQTATGAGWVRCKWGNRSPRQVFKDYFNMTVEIILKEATVEIILKEA